MSNISVGEGAQTVVVKCPVFVFISCSHLTGETFEFFFFLFEHMGLV